MGKKGRGGEEDAKDRVCDEQGRNERGQRLAYEELLVRIGVIRTGSSVPCSRSPTTE